MEDFLLYILKSAGISTLFLLCYALFLKKETFFNANRVFLLAGLVLSFVIPLISLREIVWIEPIISSPNNVDETFEPGSDNIFSLNWMTILLLVYGSGVLLLSIRLVVNLLSLKRMVTKGNCQKEDGINFVESQTNTTPFSFFNYLVYNPATLTKSDFATIVIHERMHIRDFHTLDILLMHITMTLQWFNPFIWLYKDSVEHNLEFIADQGALASGRDRIHYQNLMLKTMMGAKHPHFSNSFYNSIIKKRIVMLNKKKSQKSNLWKFGIVLPLLLAFLVIFQTTTVAQVKVTGYWSNNDRFENVFYINKNSKDAEIAEIKKSIEQKGGTFTYSLTRNTKGEITELEWELVNEGGARYSSTIASTKPFSECYFGTLKGGGVFMTPEMKDGKPVALGTSKEVYENEDKNVSLRSITGPQPLPLIVIDGVEQPNADMNNLGLEPEEIEGISVLKDKTAEEKYGAKGKNGVVEITTKKKD